MIDTRRSVTLVTTQDRQPACSAGFGGSAPRRGPASPAEDSSKLLIDKNFSFLHVEYSKNLLKI